MLMIHGSSTDRSVRVGAEELGGFRRHVKDAVALLSSFYAI